MALPISGSKRRTNSWDDDQFMLLFPVPSPVFPQYPLRLWLWLTRAIRTDAEGAGETNVLLFGCLRLRTRLFLFRLCENLLDSRPERRASRARGRSAGASDTRPHSPPRRSTKRDRHRSMRLPIQTPSSSSRSGTAYASRLACTNRLGARLTRTWSPTFAPSGVGQARLPSPSSPALRQAPQCAHCGRAQKAHLRAFSPSVSGNEAGRAGFFCLQCSTLTLLFPCRRCAAPDSCLSSTKSGAPVIGQEAFCTFGKAMTSRMLVEPVMIMARRSRP